MSLRLEPDPAFAAQVLRRDPGAGDWLGSLATLWADLAAAWDLEPAGPVRYGRVGLVVPVRRPHGAAALKLSSPASDIAAEHTALVAMAGRGVVGVYEADLARRAMLMEFLPGPSLDSWQAEGSVDSLLRGVRIAGGLAREMSGATSPGARRFADRAEGWSRGFAEQHHRATASGSAVPSDQFDAGLGVIASLQLDDSTTLTHGDLSPENIVRAGDGRWLAVDPQLLIGPVENEAHTVVRGYLPAIMASGDPGALLAALTAEFCEAAGGDYLYAQRISLARYAASYYWEAQNGGEPGNIERLHAACDLTFKELTRA